MVILSGCGGSSAPQETAPPWRTVDRGSFHFQAPKGWSISAAKGRTTAKDGSSLVQVSTFPLVHPYTDSLFTKVAGELKTRMAEVAQETGGAVGSHRVVTVDGGRAHSYDVEADGRSTSYTFVLRGLREYQLLCMADDAICTRLLTSFDAQG